VAAVVCLQSAVCLPNFLFLDTPLDLGVPWRRDLLIEPLEAFVSGYDELPARPGLGFELDMDAARAHPTSQWTCICSADGWATGPRA
jgi:L-alanine-DL-glutamate epimerase-like enolase superfamily enzyme